MSSMQQAVSKDGFDGLGVGGGGVVGTEPSPGTGDRGGGGGNSDDLTRFEQMLGKLSRDEVALLLQKHVFVASESPQKTVRAFLALLSVPVMTMFYILIVQHAPLFMKILVTVLTVVHVIVVTNFLRSSASESRGLRGSDLQRVYKTK